MPKFRNLFAFTGIIKLMFAYLDPGTGSLIIQLIIGVVVGALFVFRNSVTSLLYFFGLRKPRRQMMTISKTLTVRTMKQMMTNNF